MQRKAEVERQQAAEEAPQVERGGGGDEPSPNQDDHNNNNNFNAESGGDKKPLPLVLFDKDYWTPKKAKAAVMAKALEPHSTPPGADLLLTLQAASSNGLLEVIRLREVSGDWSRAVVEVLDSHTRTLFLFSTERSFAPYHRLLLENNLLDEEFYKIPGDKCCEVIATDIKPTGPTYNWWEEVVPRRQTPPSITLEALLSSLNHLDKLVVVDGGGWHLPTSVSLDRLLRGFESTLQSLVVTGGGGQDHLITSSLSLMGALTRLELYQVDLLALGQAGLVQLRVVLDRLEHLVLGNGENRRPSFLPHDQPFPTELYRDLWKKLFSYLNPQKLQHLGLLHFDFDDDEHSSHFPWTAVFLEDRAPGKRLLRKSSGGGGGSLTSLQLTIKSAASLRRVVALFSAASAEAEATGLQRLNLVVEKVPLLKVFEILGPLGSSLLELRLRLGGEEASETASNQPSWWRSSSSSSSPSVRTILPLHQQVDSSTRLAQMLALPSVTTFSLTAPSGLRLQDIGRPHPLPALLRHFLPNLLTLRLYDHAWAGGSTTEACATFERELAAGAATATTTTAALTVAINWTGDYFRHGSSVFPERILARHGRYGLPARCTSVFCPAAPVHHATVQCEERAREVRSSFAFVLGTSFYEDDDDFDQQEGILEDARQQRQQQQKRKSAEEEEEEEEGSKPDQGDGGGHHHHQKKKPNIE